MKSTILKSSLESFKIASLPSMHTSSPSTPTSAPPVTRTVSCSFGASIKISPARTVIDVLSFSSMTAVLLMTSLITADKSFFFNRTQTRSINHLGASSPSVESMGVASILAPPRELSPPPAELSPGSSVSCFTGIAVDESFVCDFSSDAGVQPLPLWSLDEPHPPPPFDDSDAAWEKGSDCPCFEGDSEVVPHADEPSTLLGSLSSERSIDPPGRHTSPAESE